MINRKNKKLIDEYLASRKDEVSPLTISLAETHLRLLLEFADETYFLDLPKRKQTFAQYIKSPEARRDGKEEKLSHEYSRKVISDAKHFFEWLRDEKEYPEITARFLKSFRISKENRDDEDQELYALDELLKIIATPCYTTLDERTQASCVFLFLSGMRISAFLTMPVKAFDLEARTVKQWPSLGMHTKLGIKATTKLLNIPELLEIVRKWDERVRGILPPDGFWYAPLSPITGEIDPNAEVGEYRDAGFRKDLAAFLSKASIEYKSSHKFRHGHIRFLRDRATDVRDLEAIAKNAMQTLSTMLNYGRMSKTEAHEEIDSLCGGTVPQAPVTRNGKPDQTTINWVLTHLMKEQQGML